MKYLTEINAFYEWLEVNTLADSDILLWHALMHIANKAGWPRHFTVAVQVLQVKTGMRKDRIYDARARLREAGRISWSSRKGNQSAIYEIIPFVSDTATQIPTINRLDKNRQEGDDLPESIRLQEYASKKLNKAMLSAMEIQIIFGWVQKIEQGTLDRQWIVDALEITQNRNKKNVSYANGILADWEANGRPDEARKERDAVEDVPILNFDRYKS